MQNPPFLPELDPPEPTPFDLFLAERAKLWKEALGDLFPQWDALIHFPTFRQNALEEWNLLQKDLEIADNTKTTKPLKERLLKAQIGGCTCMTKTPDLEAHNQMCISRLASEALDEIERLEGIYLSAVRGRTEMRAALKEARSDD